MQGPTTMQFKQGTSVFSSDGQDIGKIDRVVIDPRTRQVTDVILRTGSLITEDRVVPIEHVAKATEDLITLRETAADVDKLPPFEEEHYIPSNDEITRDNASGDVYSLYTYPPLKNSPIENVPVAPYIEVERNIPSNMAALREGSRVVSNDDKHIGDVDRVFLDAGSKVATHLVISQGLLFKGRKLIPADWIQEITDREVKLAVDSRLLEHLTSFNE